MVTNLPVVGVLFDWTLVGEATYGRRCWKVFWQAVDPSRITASLLWEGDADCDDRYYCIAIQSADAAKLNYIKEAISQSPEFKKIAGYPTFIEGAACTREPLVDAGRIDAAGNWVGSGGNAGVMLDVVRNERTPHDAAPSAAATPSRTASALTSALPKWTSFEELDRFCRKAPSLPRVTDEEYFWITAEELCDIVESAADIADVYFSTYSCGNSSDLCRIALRDKSSNSKWLAFSGLYPIPSVQHFVNEWDFPAEYQKMRPVLAGVKGRFVMNFNNIGSRSADSKDLIEVSSLWPRLFARRVKFLAELEQSEKQETQAREDANRREQERRKQEAAEREARKAAEATRLEAEQQRHQTQNMRKSQGLCVMCGGRLSFVDRMVRRERHGRCSTYRP